jgi:3-hydroxyisobutyrate dehydrogenase
MGGAMAQRLVEGGFALTVFDVRKEATAALEAHGAAAAMDVGEVGRRSEILFVCVVDDRQVLAVVRELAGDLAPGGVLVVASSVRPETIAEVAAMVPAGVAVVDAPVTGSRPAVANGTLTLIVGGAAADLARVEPALRTFSRRIFHVGELGTGQVVKIANNIMLHMNHLVVLEALRFARSQGVDETTVLEVANCGSGRSWVTETWGLIDDMFRDHPQAGTPGIYDMMVKEMWNAVVISKAAHTPLPLTGLGVQVAPSLLGERAQRLGLEPVPPS